MANEKDCKPGFNSCSIDGEEETVEKKVAEEVAEDGDVKCKPGFSSGSIDGEPVNETPEKSSDEKGCKPGFSSCDI